MRLSPAGETSRQRPYRRGNASVKADEDQTLASVARGSCVLQKAASGVLISRSVRRCPTKPGLVEGGQRCSPSQWDWRQGRTRVGRRCLTWHRAGPTKDRRTVSHRWKVVWLRKRRALHGARRKSSLVESGGARKRSRSRRRTIGGSVVQQVVGTIPHGPRRTIRRREVCIVKCRPPRLVSPGSPGARKRAARSGYSNGNPRDAGVRVRGVGSRHRQPSISPRGESRVSSSGESVVALTRRTEGARANGCGSTETRAQPGA